FLRQRSMEREYRSCSFQRQLPQRLGTDRSRESRTLERVQVERHQRTDEELVQYKKTHYPDDQRRILTCGIPDGNIRVEWLKAAAPGVDSRWEMQFYGLVRMGDREQAIRFLQETRGMSNKQAAKRVAAVAAELGIK